MARGEDEDGGRAETMEKQEGEGRTDPERNGRWRRGPSPPAQGLDGGQGQGVSGYPPAWPPEPFRTVA